MAKKKRAPKLRGKKRMREFGYKCCEVWFDASEFGILEDARIIHGKFLATFVREVAVAAASALLLEKSVKQPAQKDWAGS